MKHFDTDQWCTILRLPLYIYIYYWLECGDIIQDDIPLYIYLYIYYKNIPIYISY